jgi:hypothetical protein
MQRSEALHHRAFCTFIGERQMAKVWDFTVTGRGRFPLDMLRYDACYPSDQEAATLMDHTFAYGGFKGDPNPTSIKLRSRTGAPTPERWSSFGWKVSDLKKEGR